jgi:hypothetical protein
MLLNSSSSIVLDDRVSVHADSDFQVVFNSYV